MSILFCSQLLCAGGHNPLKEAHVPRINDSIGIGSGVHWLRSHVTFTDEFLRTCRMMTWYQNKIWGFFIVPRNVQGEIKYEIVHKQLNSSDIAKIVENVDVEEIYSQLVKLRTQYQKPPVSLANQNERGPISSSGCCSTM